MRGHGGKPCASALSCILWNNIFTLFPRWSVKAGRGPEWELNWLKDPVTAEHDRRAGRPEQYWGDMGDKTFKEKEDEMRSRVLRINTEHRTATEPDGKESTLCPHDARGHARLWSWFSGVAAPEWPSETV